jgi:hypothetical protein
MQQERVAIEKLAEIIEGKVSMRKLLAVGG